jgi:hypothetical protein
MSQRHPAYQVTSVLLIGMKISETASKFLGLVESNVIDQALASKCLSLIPGAYFGNTDDYGDGLMGYHVGWRGMICVYVPADKVPEWRDYDPYDLVLMLKGKVAEAGLPVDVNPDPEFIRDRFQPSRNKWQVYFTAR